MVCAIGIFLYSGKDKKTLIFTMFLVIQYTVLQTRTKLLKLFQIMPCSVRLIRFYSLIVVFFNYKQTNHTDTSVAFSLYQDGCVLIDGK